MWLCSTDAFYCTHWPVDSHWLFKASVLGIPVRHTCNNNYHLTTTRCSIEMTCGMSCTLVLCLLYCRCQNKVMWLYKAADIKEFWCCITLIINYWQSKYSIHIITAIRSITAKGKTCVCT